MPTDWKLIRQLLSSTLDACEGLDKLQIKGEETGATTRVPSGQDVTVWEYLQSCWTYPENSTYALIRARHQLKENKPYTTEAARTLLNVARFCSELLDCKRLDEEVQGVNPHQDPSSKTTIRKMALELDRWYKEEAVRGITDALGKLRK